MEITEDNYQLANDAIRSILFMYVDLIESYNGFGHNIDTGNITPATYLELIDAPVIEREGYILGVNTELMQQGSAIALLCMLSDAWDEHETWDTGWDILNLTKNALIDKRFQHMPAIEKAFKLGFSSSENKFREQLKHVYNNHVINYFKDILQSC